MEIRKIFVVGSGLMGSGIAQTALQYGYEVILNDQSKAALERGQAGISARLDRLVEKGKMTAEEKEDCMSRLTITPSVHTASNVDLVIEAIYENLDAKRAIFQQLDKICDDRTIFASNTSSISVSYTHLRRELRPTTQILRAGNAAKSSRYASPVMGDRG